MKKPSGWGAKLMGLAAGALLLGLHLWAMAALYFWFNGHAALSWAVALGYAGLVLGILKVARTRAHGALTSLVLLVAMMVWWGSRKPETGLRYPRESEQEAHAVWEGSQLTMHGIRNFQYKSETDFEPRWTTRTYDMEQLAQVDFFFVYWGVPGVAHVITSFVFKDQAPLDLSIELRAEEGEPNTMLRGFFKQYELYYLWGDERDLIQLRTTHRKEEVMLYRSALTPVEGRKLLMALTLRSNELAEEPEFYNTLTDNCAGVIARHADLVQGRVDAFYGRPLLTGSYERRGYDEGWLTHTLPWEEHRAAARVNERAVAGGDSEDFSERIRTHLPKPVVEQYPEK